MPRRRHPADRAAAAARAANAHMPGLLGEADVAARIAASVVAEMLATRTASDADTAADAPRRARASARRAERDELDAVMRVAFGEEPEAMRSFLDAAAGKPARRRTSNLRPPGVPAPRPIRRPDTPIAVRRQRAADRLESVRRLRQSAPPRRRVSRADWAGAAGTLYARLAATVLRSNGAPMWPAEIAAAVEARFGVPLGRPARHLPPALRGSPMKALGRGRKIWFEGEPAPHTPDYVPRDTETSLTRELAAETFERAVALLRNAGPGGMGVKALEDTLGAGIGDFNRDWLRQRLKCAAGKRGSGIHKAARGYRADPAETDG